MIKRAIAVVSLLAFLFGGAYAQQATVVQRPQVYLPSTAQCVSACGTHTGDLVETILAQIPIPALPAGASFTVRPIFSFPKGGTASAVQVKYYYGATGSGLGGTLYSSYSSGSTLLTGSGIFRIWNRTTSSQVGGNPNNATGVGSATIATPTSAIATTVPTEFTISATLGNAGDTATLEAYTVEVDSP